MDMSRIVRGFGWGIGATFAMSILMIIGFTTGIAPMPQPIPKAFVASVLSGLPKLAFIVLAVGAHLTYGSIWGGVLAAATRSVTTLKGLGYGVLLWVLMGIVFLPISGGGFSALQSPPRSLSRRWFCT